MNKKTIMYIIVFVIIIFALIKFIFSQLCAPPQNNPVTGFSSEVVFSAASSVMPGLPKPAETLSWEPMIHRLAVLFSKGCARSGLITPFISATDPYRQYLPLRHQA